MKRSEIFCERLEGLAYMDVRPDICSSDEIQLDNRFKYTHSCCISVYMLYILDLCLFLF